MPVGKISKFKVLRGKRLIDVSARVVEEVRLPPKGHGYEPVIQMFEVIDDRGLGLDKPLLKSYYLKKSRTGRTFPPRTVGLWFEVGVIDAGRSSDACSTSSRGRATRGRREGGG